MCESKGLKPQNATKPNKQMATKYWRMRSAFITRVADNPQYFQYDQKENQSVAFTSVVSKASLSDFPDFFPPTRSCTPAQRLGSVP